MLHWKASLITISDYGVNSFTKEYPMHKDLHQSIRNQKVEIYFLHFKEFIITISDSEVYSSTTEDPLKKDLHQFFRRKNNKLEDP